ncbi:MAG TPA: cation diffusion facilitator family transporter [Kineosporiaceae bacterium]|nr:cation diffusion facilitator family transporter [Kineosporiaceae bacterium]
MSVEGGNRAIFAALAANLGIAATKFVAYLLTLSSSMLAESIHSVADSGNQVLLIIGGRRAARKADEQHPFGYGRQRYVYAFLVSIVLFSVGGLFAIYEGVHKWQHPEPIEGRWWWVPLAVLVVAIGLESYSFRTAIVESNRTRGRRSWVQFVRTAKAPELPVVLLEDTAALCGLVFALFGVSLTLITGDGRWDAVGTLLIGLLLVLVAIVLGIEMNSLIIGESADPEAVAAIRAALVGGAVEGVIHMRTMHLGPEELLVAAKIAVRPSERADDVATAIDEAERRVRAAVPIARVIYLEPDIRRAAAAPTPAPPG